MYRDATPAPDAPIYTQAQVEAMEAAGLAVVQEKLGQIQTSARQLVVNVLDQLAAEIKTWILDNPELLATLSPHDVALLVHQTVVTRANYVRLVAEITK